MSLHAKIAVLFSFFFRVNSILKFRHIYQCKITDSRFVKLVWVGWTLDDGFAFWSTLYRCKYLRCGYNLSVLVALYIYIYINWEKRNNKNKKKNAIHKIRCMIPYEQTSESLRCWFVFCTLKPMQIYADRISKLFDMSLLVCVQWFSQNNFSLYLYVYMRSLASNLMFSLGYLLARRDGDFSSLFRYCIEAATK